MVFHLQKTGNTWHWILCQRIDGVAIGRGVQEHMEKDSCLAEIQQIRERAGTSGIADEAVPEVPKVEDPYPIPGG